VKKNREVTIVKEDLAEKASEYDGQPVLALMILEALVCATPLLMTMAFFFADFLLSMFFLFCYYFFVFLAWALSLVNIFCLRKMQSGRVEGWRCALSLMTFSEIILFGCVILSTSGFYGFMFAWMIIFAGLGILGFVLTWFLSKRYEVLLRRILMILAMITLFLDVVVLVLTLISAVS